MEDDAGAVADAARPNAVRVKKARANNGGPLGFEAKLWQAADALRNNMDAAEYKHVVLGLIFLKYISDAFEAKRSELLAQAGEGADPEDPDEYRAASIFWVPMEARWSHLKASAPQPTIGTIVDDAMTAIERDNPSLKGVLPKDFGRAGLDKQRLGQIINLVSDIALHDPADKAKDTLGRVYEYFLAQFASAEGKKGGQFYTPSRVVRVLVEMLAPYKGRVYDPCCGSGGMFVSSEQFIEAHSGKIGDISIYGQESNYTTWRLAKMNLAIRGIDAQIAHGDTFRNDQHPDLKADFVLANPPFNDSDWGGALLKDDKRWEFGVPPASNANFAWVQHFIHHLAPTGIAGFVLANGSMSSNQSGEGEIRKRIIEADLVDCMVALPGQLFYSTQIPVCLWFLTRNKANGKFRQRSGETLFIDARKMGTLVDRVHRELDDHDVAKIAGAYHAWRGDPDAVEYTDVPGFCKSSTLGDIRANGHVLTPGRYVGAADAEDDGESFEEKVTRMQAIARVNRVFRDKPGGLVVDYLGIADKLKEALAVYTDSGGTGETAIDQAEAIAVMQEKHEVCSAMFHGFDWSKWINGTPQERLSLLPAAQEHILAQDDGKARLLAAVRDLSQAFALAVPSDESMAIRDDVAFFQNVRAVLSKGSGGEAKPQEDLDLAIRQIISKAVSSEGIVDIFAAAGLKKPDISILSDEFLAEVQGMPQRNLAVELLGKLLKGEIKTRSKRNVVQAKSFSEMLERSLRLYQNRAIEAAKVIEELIQLAKDMREAEARGEQLGLTEDEVAFYDALETNDSAVAVLGDENLRVIARELVATVKANVKIDWTVRQDVRAGLRVMVKRILRKYGYPPDLQEKATRTVLEQAEVLSEVWATT